MTNVVKLPKPSALRLAVMTDAQLHHAIARVTREMMNLDCSLGWGLGELENRRLDLEDELARRAQMPEAEPGRLTLIDGGRADG